MNDEAGDNEPIIIDLGKQKRSRVKKLRSGSGSLIEDVREAIAELRETGAVQGEVVPVVLVVERKRSKNIFGF